MTCYYFYLWTPISARRSSKSAPTSPTRPRSGSTATSGPSSRPPGPGSASPSCPTGSPPAIIRSRCRRSATDCSPAPSRCSRSGGCTASRCPSARLTSGPGTGGNLHAPGRSLPHPRARRARRARAFFEALIADNLDIGRPANVEIIFNRHIRRDTPGGFRTTIDRPVIGPDTGGVVCNVLLQAFPDQAVFKGRPGDADRDRHQRSPAKRTGSGQRVRGAA